MHDLKLAKQKAWIERRRAEGALAPAEPAPTPKAAPVPAPAAAPVRLPDWPAAVRAVPNGALRSALFGAIGRGPRRYIAGEDIAAIDGVTIRYKGERLDQADLDVWATILHLARSQDLVDECRITSYALLQILGKTDTGSNRKVLETRIERLVATSLTIKQGEGCYMGSLVRNAKRGSAQEWVIKLELEIVALFAASAFTQLDWSVRQSLSGQPLAQWLHGFYASHAKPYPVKVETLLKLSGSENEDASSSRQKLRKALDAVSEASAAHGEGFGYEVQGDLVNVQKRPSGTQRRHLAKARR